MRIINYILKARTSYQKSKKEVCLGEFTDTIVIDRFSFYVFLRVLVSKHKKSIQLLWLPPRLSISLFNRINMFRLRVLKRKLVKKILSKFLPHVQVLDFDLGRYPKAKNQAGLAGVRVTETLYAEWQGRYPWYFNQLKKIFYNDSDIFLAQKKVLCSTIEDVFYKYFACSSLSEKRRTLFIVSDIENVYFLQYALSRKMIPKKSDLEVIMPSSFVSLQQMLYSISAFFFNVSAVIAIMLRTALIKIYLIRKNPKISALVALSNFCGTCRGDGPCLESRLWGDALFLVDDDSIKVKDVVILADRYTRTGEILNEADYNKAGVPIVDVRRAKMSIKRYLNEVIFRCHHFFYCLLSGLLKIDKAFSALIVPAQISNMIDWIAVCDQAFFKTYLDIDEHSYPHIIRTIISRRYGSYTIFFPHGIVQRMGSEKAYLGYSLALLPGHHLVLAYGKNWKQDMVIHIVGNVKNDGVVAYGKGLKNYSSNEFEHLIKKLKECDRKIISFFPGSISSDYYVVERNLAFVKLAAKVASKWANAIVLIKPKRAHTQFFRSRKCNNLLLPYIDKGDIQIIDGENGITCSVQCLALNSDVCVSMSAVGQSVGSSWIEAMMLGRPSFGYDPRESSLTTPLFDKFSGNLIFKTDGEILSAIGQVLTGTWQNPLWEMAKYYFDPYCDGMSISRIREILVKLASNSVVYLRTLPTVAQLFESVNNKDSRC